MMHLHDLRYLLFQLFLLPLLFVFFFNDPATTEIYTLSLHDALPISAELRARAERRQVRARARLRVALAPDLRGDRKSTRLNSSHVRISYAVFCLKKKNTLRRVSSPHQAMARRKHPVLPQTLSSFGEI